jgi:single-strand DNA-binding protein
MLFPPSTFTLENYPSPNPYQMSLNNMVMLIGYVGQHLKMSKTANGIKRLTIRVATHDVSKGEKQRRETTWHDVIAWGGLADLAASNFVKGSRIRVHGSICYRSFPGKEGHTRYIAEIKAEFLQNLDR